MVLGEVKRTFNPEFINRIDEIIVFEALTDDDLRRIMGLLVTQLNENLVDRKLQHRADAGGRRLDHRGHLQGPLVRRAAAAPGDPALRRGSAVRRAHPRAPARAARSRSTSTPARSPIGRPGSSKRAGSSPRHRVIALIGYQATDCRLPGPSVRSSIQVLVTRSRDYQIPRPKAVGLRLVSSKLNARSGKPGSTSAWPRRGARRAAGAVAARRLRPAPDRVNPANVCGIPVQPPAALPPANSAPGASGRSCRASRRRGTSRSSSRRPTSITSRFSSSEPAVGRRLGDLDDDSVEQSMREDFQRACAARTSSTTCGSRRQDYTFANGVDRQDRHSTTSKSGSASRSSTTTGSKKVEDTEIDEKLQRAERRRSASTRSSTTALRKKSKASCAT